MTMEAIRTDTDTHIGDEARPTFGIPTLEQWIGGSNRIATVTASTETSNRYFRHTDTWLSPETIAEAKLRFKDALEDAEEEEIPTPSDSVLSNALRAVQMIDDHCPQGLSSVAVLEEGMMATARGAGLNYISVECQKNGEVLVMFNVRSYAKYKDMDEAEREGFLKALLETVRY